MDRFNPSQIGRLSERYPANGLELEWIVPSRRKFLKDRELAIKVHVLDVSVTGALLAAPEIAGLQIGDRVKFRLNGDTGTASVRHIRMSSTGETCFYGVSFVELNDTLSAELFDAVAVSRGLKWSDIDQAWLSAR